MMTETLDQAREIERIAQEEDWRADNVTPIQGLDERTLALGTSEPGHLISFWWD